MLFSKINGLWRNGDYIFISAEYHNIKFHINEIGRVQIVDENGLTHTAGSFPIKKARILFILKSGRTKTCYIRKLTTRRYKYLLHLLKTERSETHTKFWGVNL